MKQRFASSAHPTASFIHIPRTCTPPYNCIDHSPKSSAGSQTQNSSQNALTSPANQNVCSTSPLHTPSPPGFDIKTQI